MTMLDDPPVAVAATPTPAVTRTPSARWTFALRLARREVARRPGRTLLTGALIAAPVMAMTVGSVLARTSDDGWSAQFERRYGDADLVVDPSFIGMSVADGGAPVQLPPGTTSIEQTWTFSMITPAPEFGGAFHAALTDLSFDPPGAGRIIEVRSGRAPGAGELLLTERIADELGVTIGDDVTLERPSGTWTVAAIGRHRDSYSADVVVIPDLAPERFAPEFRQTVTLYDLPDGVDAADASLLAGRLGGFTAADDPIGSFDAGSSTMVWGWVAGALALVGVGIIVAAAFATSARHQLVTIGQLAANGASSRLVRRTLALQGTWTGLAGGLVGVAAGLGVLPVARPLAERVASHDLGGYRVVTGDLIVIVATAVVAGTLAALVPAASAARIPVIAALAGRRPQGRLPRWLVPFGLAVLGVGLGLVALGALGASGTTADQSSGVWAVVVVVGVLGVVAGTCCASPLVVERIGRLGRRLPLSPRLALRSLSRSRLRSSAVVTAIAVAVGGGVAGSALVEQVIRNDQAGWRPTLPADAVVFELWRDPGYTDERFDTGALTSIDLPADIRAEVLEVLPGATIEPLLVATVDPPSFDPVTGAGPWPQAQGPRIATPGLIELLGLSTADRDALDRTGALRPASPSVVHDGAIPLDERADELTTTAFPTESGSIEVATAVGRDLPAYEFAMWGADVMTEQRARELGFGIVTNGVIVRAASSLDDVQREALRAIGNSLATTRLDSFVEPGDPERISPTAGVPDEEWGLNFDDPSWRIAARDDVWVARAIIGGAALLLSLLVVAIGLALAAAEGRDERDLLGAVGARPASIRRQAAWRAVVLAVSGIALGVPTGFVPAWIVYRVVDGGGAFGDPSLTFPWLVVGALVLAVPVFVAGVAWTGSLVAQRAGVRPPRRRD